MEAGETKRERAVAEPSGDGAAEETDQLRERRGAERPDPLVDRGDAQASPREVSAVTVGRMLGLATVADLQLMEGKIDLLSTRVNTLSVRLEKILGVLQNAPTGSDLERIDVQLGSLKMLIRDALMMTGSGQDDGASKAKRRPGEAEKSISSGKIVSNTD